MAKRGPNEWYVTPNAPYIATGEHGPVYGVVTFDRETTTETYFEYARIMAAAPDLLAACQEMLEFLASHGKGRNPYEIMVDARAAIAKATKIQSRGSRG